MLSFPRALQDVVVGVSCHFERRARSRVLIFRDEGTIHRSEETMIFMHGHMCRDEGE
jgi:hypothetical protein